MTPQRRRSGSSPLTRDALVAAATALVAERGHAGATARAVAARAGVNQALVFYHFGSVDQLLVAALEEVSARRMAAFGELVEGIRTLPDLLGAFDRIVREDVRSGDLSFLVALLDAARRSDGLREAVAAALAPWQELTERLVGRLAGRLPLGGLLPRPALARLAMGMVLGTELLSVLDRQVDGRQTAGGPGEHPGAT